MEQIEALDNELERIGWGRYSYYNFLACGGAWVVGMLWSVGISIILYSADWDLTEYQKGVIGTLSNLGLFVGSYLFGYLGDLAGRVLTFKVVGGVTFLGGVLSVLCTDYSMMRVVALVLGVGIGGEIALGGPSYLELCPPSKRWTTVLMSACWVVGGVLAGLLGLLIETAGLTWKYLPGVSLMMQVVVWGLRLFLLESPKFLYIKGRIKKCECTLKKLALANGNSEPEVSLDYRFLLPKQKSSLKKLFSKEYLKKTLLFSVLLFLSDLSFSATVLFMPSFLNQLGVVSKGLYSTMVLQMSTGIPGIALASYTVETCLGRKGTVAVGYFLCGLSCWLFMVSNSYLEVLVFSCGIYLFSFTGYSAAYTLVSESYPTEIRSLGVGWTHAWCKFGGFVSPLTVGVLLQNEGGLYISILIVGFCFSVVGVLALLTTETRNRSIA